MRKRTRGRPISRRGLAWLAAWACVTAVTPQEPSEVLEQIRTATLDPQRAVELRAVEIDMGLGTVLIEQGWLVPARARRPSARTPSIISPWPRSLAASRRAS